MIKDGVIKKEDMIFLYSSPPENSFIGVVSNIKYPILSVTAIRINSEETINKIDISQDIPLTVLSQDQIKKYLSQKQIKQINILKKQSENDESDIFMNFFEG